MSDTKTVTVRSGPSIGFAGLLTILFIALKLTGVITWSWVWVLSPLWISFLIGVTIFLIVLGIIVWVEHLDNKSRRR
jgi:predicted tellurium resistance membrane protein TerC